MKTKPNFDSYGDGKEVGEGSNTISRTQLKEYF